LSRPGLPPGRGPLNGKKKGIKPAPGALQLCRATRFRSARAGESQACEGHRPRPVGAAARLPSTAQMNRSGVPART
jgi:hypothetical protein